MTQTVAQEFFLFLVIPGMGAGIGLLFDCYRLLLRRTRLGYFSIQLSDLFFWVLCAGPVFYVFFMITGGEVRFVHLLLLPAGIAVYLKFLSPYVREPLNFCFIKIGEGFYCLVQALRFCAQVLFFPFRLAVWGVNFALQFFCGLLRLIFLPVKFSLRWVWRWIRELWRNFRKP